MFWAADSFLRLDPPPSVIVVGTRGEPCSFEVGGATVTNLAPFFNPVGRCFSFFVYVDGQMEESVIDTVNIQGEGRMGG